MQSHLQSVSSMFKVFEKSSSLYHLHVGQEPVVPADATSLETQILADKIAALVNMKFSELTNNLTTPQANRKVLAGIVLSPPEGGLDALTVISVTTGTKCVGGDCISSQVSNKITVYCVSNLVNVFQ